MEEFWKEAKKKKKEANQEDESSDDMNSEIYKKNNNSPMDKEPKLRKRNHSQSYFCIGYSDVWRKVPIHATLTKLWDKFNPRWLRISMLYHKFPNMRELFQSDLTIKVTKT